MKNFYDFLTEIFLEGNFYNEETKLFFLTGLLSGIEYNKEINDKVTYSIGLEEGYSKGRENGYEHGIVLGRLEERASLAQKMLKHQYNIPQDVIAECTNFQEEEIQYLKDTMIQTKK